MKNFLFNDEVCSEIWVLGNSKVFEKLRWTEKAESNMQRFIKINRTEGYPIFGENAVIIKLCPQITQFKILDFVIFLLGE